MPVLAMIVFGVLDLGRAYRMQIQLDAAAREGARHAQLYPNEVDCAAGFDIVGAVIEAEPSLETAPGYSITVLGEDASGELTVPVTGCTGTAVEAGERVRIRVQAEYGILTPMVGAILGNALVLTGSNEVEVLG